MKNTKLHWTAGILVLILLVVLMTRSSGCDIKKIERTVTGNSLEGLIEPGERIIAREGYYRCNEVKRNDVVLYNHPGEGVFIKVVRALPGDTIALVPNPDGETAGLMINNELLKTSQNRPYRLSKNAQGMLSLYIRDYKGVIPPNAYLILGNVPDGSNDSTRFGLVSKNAFVASVIR